MRKPLAFLLSIFSWIALGPFLKPVQFFIHFLPYKEGTDAYFNSAILIGILLITIFYYLWLIILKRIDKINS